MATPSNHERRVNLYFELAWQPPRHSNGRAGRATSRHPAPVRARAAARVRGVHARPHMLRLDGRLALDRGLLRPSSELSGAGSRGADQLVGRKVERDRRGARAETAGAGTASGDRAQSRPATKSGRRGATAFERRAGEQNAAPPCASFCSNFTGTSMSYAVRRNHFVLGVFTISSVIAPSPNS